MRPSAIPTSRAICLVEVASKPCAAKSLRAVFRICSRRAAACRWREVSRRPVGGTFNCWSASLIRHRLASSLSIEDTLIEYLLIINHEGDVVNLVQLQTSG